MDYRKQGKTGTVNRQFNQARTAALMTGIGQTQSAALQNGQYRAELVAAAVPSGRALPALDPCCKVDPRGVTPAEDTQEPA